MSGGGIVEVSEKVSSRISSYEAYLSGTSINNPVVQRKSSSIFSLSARDSCKSEIMTLTSCSTGESVTLHSFSGSRSPLPLQVSAVSETEALPVNVSQTIEMGVSSNNSSIMLPIERTEVIDKINNSSEEKPCEIPVPSGAEKDETLASSIKSPLMQNNYLPHSPSAPTDSKTVVQEINCPSDQTQSQSASSLKLESTVPLSLHSASSPTCNANETASNFSVQMQVSDSTDANRLPKPERVVANPLGNVSSSTDSQKLQNIHQCNINSDNKLTEKLDSVNIDERVQKEASVHETTSSCKENTTVNEVQKSVDVNKNATANRKESELCENVKNQSSHSSMPLPSHNDGDKCKNLLFSNHSESYDSSVSYLTPVPKKDNEFVEISDKNMCIAEMKKSPIAQIISADNLPIQPHVIEVPFQHSSLAVPNALAKSGCVAEISSVSSLIPSSGNTFVPVRNILVMHDTSNVAFCEGRSSDINIANTTSVISHSESFPVYTLPSKPETKIKLLNHIDIDMQESSNVKASSTPSSSNASEESSMDSIDEERKRCMQLSEIPTSTPGPPLTETSILNTDNLPKPLESSAEKNTCSTTIADKPVEPSGNENKPVSQKYESRNVPIEGQYAESSSVKDITPLVSQHSPLVAPSIQPPVLSNTTTTNEISSEEKISCSSSGIYIPTSSGLPLQKESQSESNANVLTSDSTPSVLVMQDPVPLVGLENRSLPTKLDVKKEPCSDSVHLISTPGNPVVTSLLSPVKYLPSEVGSQKFKLIFKGSGQRASLQSSNSPASLVVPLNSSKAVPIKFVTLPSASALSVRSTSNPNIVEIISPKASSSQNAPLSGTSHPSSPVRLVVSKVSPGLSCTNQSGTQNLRNRVVVKSVVMTGTSPSLKLVSTNSLCTSTAVLTNSGGITTSSTSQVVACPTSSSSSHVMRLFTDEMKPTTVVENSSMQLNSVCCLSEVTNVEVAELKNNKESNDGIKNLLKATSSAIKCSTSADSTTKDLPPSEPLVRNSVVNETVPINPMSADSSTFNSVVSPDTTTVSTTNNSENENIVSSNNELTTQVPSVENSECVSSEQVFNSTNNSCDNESNNKSAADTTSEIISVSSVVDDQKLDIKLESHINNEDKISLSSKQLAENDNAVLQTENCKNSVNSIIENSNNEYEINPRTVITSSESDDLIKSEQTADSAITTSLNYISNELESSDAADSSSIPNNPIFSDIENKQNIESVTVNLETSINNSVEIASVNPCEMENEVIIASNVEVGIAETSECAEISQNSELDCSDIKLEQSVAVETPKNELHNDSQVVLLPEDSDSLDEKCNVDMQKFRPLGDESIGVVDSTESDSTGVIIEDSQLEISLVYSKPLKRKCSENAAELIKACMGVEDCPKKAVLMKAKVAEEIVEKIENEKLEENVRMSLRIRKEDTNMKKPKGSTVNSDCSTDEEITLSELIKTRTREKPPRGRLSNRDSPVEPNNLKPGRRRSNSNESRNSEEIKTRAPRECKRETIKKNEPSKKLPERTKKGTLKAQDQVVISKVGVQRSGRIRDQEAAKANMLNNNKEESNSIGAKRKTRATAGKIQKNQKTIPQERRRSTRNAGSSKRRRFSKDGHR